MKGLLLKDLYVISGQMKFFCILALVMAARPGFTSSFAVVYAAMLPYTALAYDERSKWDQLAAMMPYSTRDIVLSKYVLGWLCIGTVTLIAGITQLVMPNSAGALTLLPIFCAALLTLDLVFPFMLRFGVEKGRTVFLFIMVGFSVGATTLLTSLAENNFDFSRLNLFLPVVTALATYLSLQASIWLYPKRKN